MKWINKLERKFGRYAIKNLMGHIVAITAIVYLFSLMDPNRTFLSSLELIPQKVLQGEIWRLITYIFIPHLALPFTLSFLFTCFISWVHHWRGTGELSALTCIISWDSCLQQSSLFDLGSGNTSLC